MKRELDIPFNDLEKIFKENDLVNKFIYDNRKKNRIRNIEISGSEIYCEFNYFYNDRYKGIFIFRNTVLEYSSFELKLPFLFYVNLLSFVIALWLYESFISILMVLIIGVFLGKTLKFFIFKVLVARINNRWADTDKLSRYLEFEKHQKR